MSIQKTNWLFLLYVIFFYITARLPMIKNIGIPGLAANINYLITFLIALAFLKSDKAKLSDSLPFHKKISLKAALLIIIITLASRPLVALFYKIGGAIFGDTIELMKGVGGFGTANTPLLVMIIMSAVLPALCEEVFCRGFFYEGFRKAKGPRYAILITSFMFGVMHMNYQQALYTFIAGIFIAVMRELTSSIWAGILYHFVNNGLATLENKYDGQFWTKLAPVNIASVETLNAFLISLAVAILGLVIAMVALTKLASLQDKSKQFHTLFGGDKGEDVKHAIRIPFILALIPLFLYATTATIAVKFPQLML